MHVNDVLKSKSYYDGSGARRIHETYPAGRKETIAYGGEHMTLRNGVDLTYHIYAEGQRVASREGANYTSGETIWFHTDRLGSTVNSTDANGELTSTMEYFPSGEPWIQRFESSSAQAALPKFMFAGKEYDEATGLYNFGARHYDPRMGVWMSPDPAMPEYFVSSLAGGVYQPKNLNTYSYAWNNPVSVGDSDGRAADTLWDAFNVAVGVASFAVHAYQGDWDSASDDAVGVAVDVVAMAVPFVPGGAAASLRAARAAEKTYDTVKTAERAADAVRTVDRATDAVRTVDRGSDAARSIDRANDVPLKRFECFEGSTKVETLDGLVAIKRIERGDWVWARDPRTGEESWKRVTRVFVTPGREVLELRFVDPAGEEEMLVVTPDHPVWSLDDDDWDLAGNLEFGERVDSLGGALELVSELVRPELETVYNLEIEGAHTFFVGEDGVWVHNSCGDIPQATSAGHNGFHGPAREVRRPARYGKGPAKRVEYPDGSFRELSRQRVKEKVPNRHPRAPENKTLDVRYDNPIPNTKGKKRRPTAAELSELE